MASSGPTRRIDGLESAGLAVGGLAELRRGRVLGVLGLRVLSLRVLRLALGILLRVLTLAVRLRTP